MAGKDKKGKDSGRDGRKDVDKRSELQALMLQSDTSLKHLASAMYHSWMQDDELQEMTSSEPLTLDQEYEMQHMWRDDEDKCTFIVLDKEDYERTKHETDSMIGDVNLFFNSGNHYEAEVEIMIAEVTKRTQGKGKEALLFMLRYGIEILGATTFIAKIKRKNFISLQLFQKIGFVQVSESEIFQEVTLECLMDDHFYSWLLESTMSYNLIQSEVD